MSGMASTCAHTKTYPKRIDHKTACHIPFGTLTAAFFVSSDVCAEASYPVMVYVTRSSPTTKAYNILLVWGQTPPPAVPVKFVNVNRRLKSRCVGAKAIRKIVNRVATTKIR